MVEYVGLLAQQILQFLIFKYPFVGVPLLLVLVFVAIRNWSRSGAAEGEPPVSKPAPTDRIITDAAASHREQKVAARLEAAVSKIKTAVFFQSGVRTPRAEDLYVAFKRTLEGEVLRSVEAIEVSPGDTEHFLILDAEVAPFWIEPYAKCLPKFAEYLAFVRGDISDHEISQESVETVARYWSGLSNEDRRWHSKTRIPWIVWLSLH